MRVIFDNGTPRGVATGLIKRRLTQIAAAVGAATPGSFTEVEIPTD